MKKYAITIARGYGSGGRRIGRKLADVLGIDFVDRELLRLASDESGISEAIFGQADERLTSPLQLFKSFRKNRVGPVLSPEQDGFVSDENLFNFQAKVLRGLIEKESFVVMGRAANFILRDYENVLTVNIQAPRGACVKEIMRVSTLSEKEADLIVTRTDRYRADFYEYYTGMKWNEPSDYDICLNSERLGDDGCIRLIMECARMKWGAEFMVMENRK